MLRVLIVEDDQRTAQFIMQGMREHGHLPDHASDGAHALILANENDYDVWIIDRMVPYLDGLSLLKALREGGGQTPALFLSALGSLEERVAGLNAGGDDYLVKPFAFTELLARVLALARRPPMSELCTELRLGGLVLELTRHKVMCAGEEIMLSPTEFRLLEFLMRHAGKVVTRTMLLEQVWGLHFEPKTSVVETHISRLRSKVEREGRPSLITTVRGVGYIFDEV